MTSSRVFAVCATLLVLGMPLTAGADPGDPRLVSGVLEWPVVATSTPFVIIRGDNGVLYYVSVAAARRAGAVKAGARVSVLGIEGPTAHEIRAVGMGSGPTAEARRTFGQFPLRSVCFPGHTARACSREARHRCSAWQRSGRILMSRPSTR